MSDTRQLQTKKESADFYSLAVFINAVYCRRFGYNFIFYHIQNDTFLASLHNIWNIIKTGGVRTWFKKFIMRRGFRGADTPVCYNKQLRQYRSAPWAKIIAVQKALSYNNPIVVYIDSDCIFRNQKTSIDQFTDNTPTRSGGVIFEKSAVGFINNAPNYPDVPCGGFFVLKNNEQGVSFLEQWWNYPNRAHNLKFSWEQSTIEKIYPASNHPICLWDAASFYEYEGQFLRHISHFEHEQRYPYFLRFVNELEKEFSVRFEDIMNNIKIRNLVNPVW